MNRTYRLLGLLLNASCLRGMPVDAVQS
ncbi:leu operon leader peptide [Serratia proteamaculans]|uniref:Leu operon leader peptide n=1 Tax=Serratia proteamaculans TaxID=28151 RepID=A0A7U0NB91_SERPR|nr:leu operon leader peptide [Serratia proteamaculans]HCV66524.1 hypothetical protein [Serratia sp. (in: enterobacteria)]MBI6180220.1 leu operon leader peptide [Serratia proteamaculans]MBO1504578.1 leu operon leader peptide [Serratia proteamaculans]NWA72766.1 leu operon leader peptide [Serratia proteamaculans]